MRISKSLFTLAFAMSISLASNSAHAEGYTIESLWSGGDQYVLSYDPALPAAQSVPFSVTHDEAAQVVYFSFPGVRDGGCRVGINDLDEGRPLVEVYYQAVDLAENIDLVQGFRVQAWGGICFSVGGRSAIGVSDVEYRTDIKKVEFTCDNGGTYWGQSVYVVGNTARLGSWSPAKAVKLDPTSYPTWTGRVTVENNTNVAYKCIKRSELNPTQGVVWQSGGNRTFYSGTTDSVRTSF